MKQLLIGLGVLSALLLAALCASALAEELPEEITLYYLPTELVEKGVQLPSDHPSTYQFPMESDADYRYLGAQGWLSAEDSDCLHVSQSGLAEALPQSISSYTPSKTLYVVMDGKLSTVKVNLVSYASDYASGVLDEYIANEITADMTDLEKVEALANIAARDFDYGTSSTYVSMIIKGSGSCWASADFIIEGCDRLGIKAGFRPEPWETSSHRSALVAIGDALYNIEAGYSGQKPRRYTIDELNGDYTYGTHTGFDGTNGINLARYERMYAEPEKAVHMVVPNTYDSRLTKFVPSGEPGIFVREYEYTRDLPVLSIGDNYFTGRFCSYSTETIELPKALEVIFKYAFYSTSKLHDVVLPDTVRTIGEYAFYGCKSLGEITVPDKVTALPGYVFADCGTLTIHLSDAVTEIADTAFNSTNVTIDAPYVSYASRFARRHNLSWHSDEEILQLPKSLLSVEASAFAGTAADGVVLPEGVRSIGANAFSACNNLKWVEIPASVTGIDPTAFSGLGGVTILAPSGSEAEAFASDNGLQFTALDD